MDLTPQKDEEAAVVPPRLCYTCETGHMRPTGLRGRRVEYRGAVVTVDEGLVVPVCDACAEMQLGGERTTHFNRIVERLRAAAL